MTNGEVPVGLEFAFETRVEFGADRCIFGPLPGGGGQGYTPCTSGTVYGPMLQGRVVPHSGADYASVRGDGTIVINSHYLLEADDGTKIYINNRGYLIPATGTNDLVVDGVTQPSYFRFTPTFVVPDGKHAWMGRTLIVGGGYRKTNPDHSIFSYYIVR